MTLGRRDRAPASRRRAARPTPPRVRRPSHPGGHRDRRGGQQVHLHEAPEISPLL